MSKKVKDAFLNTIMGVGFICGAVALSAFLETNL